jgi:hypothetical protein
MFLSTKFSTKKFHLVSKYANYPTWDEKQNAPFIKIVTSNKIHNKLIYILKIK